MKQTSKSLLSWEAAHSLTADMVIYLESHRRKKKYKESDLVINAKPVNQKKIWCLKGIRKIHESMASYHINMDFSPLNNEAFE